MFGLPSLSAFFRHFLCWVQIKLSMKWCELHKYSQTSDLLIQSFIIIWLAPWAGKMNRILRCDWLPERARWRYLARLGLPGVSRKKIVFFFDIINPLLTKLVQPRWLDIGLALFCVLTDRDGVEVHKHAKKRTWSISSHFSLMLGK